jgi:ADP-heptose:LPS heptosyltransferase
LELRTKKLLDFSLGGVFIGLLKPFVVLLGRLLHRDHTPVLRDRMAVIKLMGGGSLVIALPALLGLRTRYPLCHFVLVTTPGVAPFGEALGIFDELIVLDDSGISRLIVSTLGALRRLGSIDTVIDLEVYSRLTTVLSVLTRARNRVGFYLETVFWREGLSTHLIFFNRFSGNHLFYEAIAALFGAQPATRADCARQVTAHLATRSGATKPTEVDSPLTSAATRAALGFACSDLGRERMLSPDQWARVLPPRLRGFTDVHLLGSASDREAAAALMTRLEAALPAIRWHNDCDGRSLDDSLRMLSECSLFLGIDSAMLHFARLFGLPSKSFWGPTDPSTLLKDFDPELEEITYVKIACSPCIHVAEVPPCRGNNVCMAMAVAVATAGPRPTPEALAQPLYWLAPGRDSSKA